MTSEINPRTLFLELQKNLVRELETSRSATNHPTTKGNASEVNWIDMLKIYLPKRYQVSSAFIIDSKGNLSEQQDIVIFDQQYSPFIFNNKGILYIPAESVYAVFEVKQILNSKYVDYAGQKIESVRNLYRTNAQITHAGGKYDKPKELFTIIGGLLTLDCEWSPAFGEPFLKSIQAQPTNRRINLGCSLKNGSYRVTYENNEKSTVKIKDGDVILLSFFLSLLSELQSLGSAPAIEIDSYAKWI